MRITDQIVADLANGAFFSALRCVNAATLGPDNVNVDRRMLLDILYDRIARSIIDTLGKAKLLTPAADGTGWESIDDVLRPLR